jgi:DNA invertase Pin-like site-specific DNA recombinase
MLIGYARVSTPDQYLRLQEDALKSAGCGEIYTDIASGVKTARPGLHSALSHLRKGDTLVVWKLDRLGRSLAHLIQTVKELSEKGIGFKSLQENIDTTTSGGQLIFHIFGALAEFERELIRERTQAGLKAARVRGRLGGRPTLLNVRQIKKMKDYYKKGDLAINEICKLFNITKPTLYRYLRNNN